MLMLNSVACRVFFASQKEFLLNSELFFQGLRDAKNFYYFNEEYDILFHPFNNAYRVKEFPRDLSPEDVVLITKPEEFNKLLSSPSFCYFNLEQKYNFGPLTGLKVLIPRMETDDQKSSGQFGAVGIEVPLLKINYLLDQNILSLDFSNYDWLILTSAHGVRGFFFNLQQLKIDFRKLACLKIAVVGEKTAKVLEEYGFNADFTPQKFTAEALARELLDGDLIKKNVIIVQGSLGRKELWDIFINNNYLPQKLLVYENRPNTEMKPFLNSLLKANLIDVLFFTSPSTFNNFYQFIEEEPKALKLPHVAIGPTTFEVFQKKDILVKLLASKYTIDGMWQSLKNYYQGE